MNITEQDASMINEVFKDFKKFLKTGEADRGDYFDLCRGLCHNIFDLFYENSNDLNFYRNIDRIRDKIFKSWQYFSGTLIYPIPFRTNEEQDEEILDIIMNDWHHQKDGEAYCHTKNQYDKNTDYGRLRLDLYQHIKDNLFDVISEL